MPHSNLAAKRNPRPGRKLPKGSASQDSARYTVALAPSLAHQVENYAQATDSSMSKAIAALVRIGLEGQEQRKREFFKKMKANLANDDPSQEDQLVDEFRSLILGR
jgi:hypothetical protein